MFLANLPVREENKLAALSATDRDDTFEDPGSIRDDEAERLFLESLLEEDRIFLEGHRGLGNSQKAEVCWLEKKGYPYIEMSVRDWQNRCKADAV